MPAATTPEGGSAARPLDGLPVRFAARCRRHLPAAEVWVGVPGPGTEVPARADAVLTAVTAAGAAVREPAPCDDALLLDVHDPGLVEHLRTVHARWVAAGYPQVPGQPQVVPYVFPTAGMLGGLPGREPVAVHAAAGRWCYDTMTLVGEGTWEAARAAVDAAADAATTVAAGQPLAYALVRPPGHHVTRSAYGGSCYLNNAALAVAALQRAGVGRVAVVDVDAHHGNGTQAVFWRRADVLYASVHVDPAAGWFPHYAGFADETGAGPGRGTTLNLPLPPGAGDAAWCAAVERAAAAVAAFGAEAVVVSLGVDAAEDDPESPLRVSAEGYRRAGSLLHGLGPAVAVQEGGYHLPTLGPLVVATLDGLRHG